MIGIRIEPTAAEQPAELVIEVVQDLSEDLEAIIRLQGRVIVLSLAIMAVCIIVNDSQLTHITDQIEMLFDRGDVGWREILDVDETLEPLFIELDGFQIQFEDAPTGAFGADGEEEIAQPAVLEFIAGG